MAIHFCRRDRGIGRDSRSRYDSYSRSLGLGRWALMGQRSRIVRIRYLVSYLSPIF